ncbi:MAG: hypothetical protein BWY70_01510 [Bacteroidetes bacterium ADurb.Bin408]|nr:MAG: hypothetical protein BWY70_01510 [Bacteroidetes bacterium ADurb.Bin408]
MRVDRERTAGLFTHHVEETLGHGGKISGRQANILLDASLLLDCLELGVESLVGHPGIKAAYIVQNISDIFFPEQGRV